jgi:hypothetical protein
LVVSYVVSVKFTETGEKGVPAGCLLPSKGQSLKAALKAQMAKAGTAKYA